MNHEKEKKAMQELVEETERLRQAFKNSVNDLGRPEELAEAISRWQEKRKGINALGIGLILGIKQFEFAQFPLAGDPIQDLGQVRPQEVPPDPVRPDVKEGRSLDSGADDLTFDDTFLGKLGIKKPE